MEVIKTDAKINKINDKITQNDWMFQRINKDRMNVSINEGKKRRKQWTHF